MMMQLHAICDCLGAWGVLKMSFYYSGITVVFDGVFYWQALREGSARDRHIP